MNKIIVVEETDIPEELFKWTEGPCISILDREAVGMGIIDNSLKHQLDLHGVRHEDVTRKVVHFIEDHWDCGEEVEIITGHSKVMRRLVEKTLDEYKLDYAANLFLPFIRVTL